MSARSIISAARRLPTRGRGWIGDVVELSSRRFKPFVVPYADEDGTEHQVGHADEAAAVAFRETLLRAEWALPSNAQPRPFGEAVRRVVDGYSGRTLITIRSTAKLHVLPGLDRKPIHRITQKDYQAFVARLDGMSGTQRRRAIRIFHDAIAEAKAMNWVSKQIGFTAPRLLLEETKMRKVHRMNIPHALPSREQLNLLLERSEGYLRIFVHIAIHAGLRRGEILGLEWGDLELNLRKIRVRASVSDSGNSETKPVRGPVKTSNGIRSVPINDELLRELRNWRARWANSNPSPDDRVLFPPGHAYVGAARLCEDFNRLQASVGLAVMGGTRGRKRLGGFRIHMLRHACVAVWIWAGVPNDQIRRMIGHANLHITLGLYGYLIKRRHDGQRTWPVREGEAAVPAKADDRTFMVRGHRHRAPATTSLRAA
jgi:integrase